MRRAWREFRWRAVAAMLLAGWNASALGYDDRAVRVARLSFLSGEVTVEQADNTSREAGVRNMPLPEGTRVVTAGGGEAEIEFEDGSLLRLTPNSAVTLTSLKVDGGGTYLTRMDVLRGLVYAELRATKKYGYLLEAGGDGISPVRNSTVRVEFDEPPPVVAVLDGAVQVSSGLDGGTGGFTTEVQAGESLSSDAKDGSRYYRSQGVEKESWDQWNEDRDAAAASEAQTRTTARDGYAGSEGYGWSDLDANGSWYDVGGAGEVWQPKVAALGSATGAGFDPYGVGSWTWFAGGFSGLGAGYVFNSGYSWGWTPYQCGSWSYWSGFGWGWSPAAACGFGGGRFGAGGLGGTIGQGPPNYHWPRPPRPVPGGGHPVVPVHPGGGVVNLGMLHDGSIAPGVRHDGSMGSTLATSGPVIIGGQSAVRLRPVGGGSAWPGGSAVGSSLRRDFPMDAASGRPMMGVFAGSMPAAPSVMPGSLEWVREQGTGGRLPVGAARGVDRVPGVAGELPGAAREGYVGRVGGQVAPAGSTRSVPARPGPPPGQVRPIIRTAPAPAPMRPPAAAPAPARPAGAANGAAVHR